MTTTRIPATADDAAAVQAAFATLAANAPPADPGPGPAQPRTAPGRWVDASGRSATEAGAVVYAHGGGFRHTEPGLELLMARRLSAAARRPVFAVDYRLTPAHHYPAPLDDVMSVYRDLLGQGVPASGILLFGESAGGTLVLSALLAMARDGLTPPAGAAAACPLTDLTLSSPSLTDPGGRDTADRTVLAGATADYLNGAPPDRAPQSPLHGDLAGLPPLLLAAGEADALADDARRFAAASEAAGTATVLDLYAAMPHVFHIAGLGPEPPRVPAEFWRRFAEWAAARG
ncbi:MAG TPA: alpha/beta hydrolase [Streptosporangiaceae bacterium]|jgi:acetyl esterase/lipase